MAEDQSPSELPVDERKRRLEIGLRRNKSRLILPEWLATLSSLLGIKIGKDTLVSLEETDRLKKDFYKRVQAPDVRCLYWDGHESVEVLAALQALNAQPSLQILLFSHEDYTVAVRVPLGLVLDNAIWYIGDNIRDVSLVTPSFDAGLLFGLSHFGHTPEGYSKDEYELRVWGNFAELSEGVSGARASSRWDNY